MIRIHDWQSPNTKADGVIYAGCFHPFKITSIPPDDVMKLQKSTIQRACEGFKIESRNFTSISFKSVPDFNSSEIWSEYQPLNFFVINLLTFPLTVKSNG